MVSGGIRTQNGVGLMVTSQRHHSPLNQLDPFPTLRFGNVSRVYTIADRGINAQNDIIVIINYSVYLKIHVKFRAIIYQCQIKRQLKRECNGNEKNNHKYIVLLK